MDHNETMPKGAQRSGSSVCDGNVREVVAQLLNRSQAGYLKYGTTTERKDINLIGWLQHLQEELLDAAVYIQRIKNELNGPK